METKEFCGAPWPSKELKRKEWNSYCPLNAPWKFVVGAQKNLEPRVGVEPTTCRLVRKVHIVGSLGFVVRHSPWFWPLFGW
jgi:hypothetical protein